MWKLSLMWKMSLLNVTAVKIELAVLIEPAVEIEPDVEIEPAALISAAQFPHPGSISTLLTLKSLILFLFDFKKSSIVFHVRGNGSFPGLNFHITEVEIEPAVLKEIPP